MNAMKFIKTLRNDLNNKLLDEQIQSIENNYGGTLFELSNDQIYQIY